jgi:hypothetical protein
MNGYKGNMREALRTLARALRAQERELRDLVK